MTDFIMYYYYYFHLVVENPLLTVYTTEITELWNGPKFLHCDHTHCLLLTHPHSSVVSSHNFSAKLARSSVADQLKSLNGSVWIQVHLSIAIE